MIAVDLVSASDASVNIASIGFDLGDLRHYSVHCDFSGTTLAGTLKLQSSNDNADWVDIANSSQSITSAASFLYNVIDACYRYVRVSWTASSGTGTLTAHLSVKAQIVKIS